jgi:hypothetical protein
MLGKGAPRFRDDGSFAGYIGCLLDITDYRSIPTAGAGGTARCTCGRLYPPPPAASA